MAFCTQYNENSSYNNVLCELFYSSSQNINFKQTKKALLFMRSAFFTPPNRVRGNIEPCSSGRCPISVFTAPNVRHLLSGQVN